MLVSGLRRDSEKAYDPASVHKADKEERAKEEEAIDKLSKAPRTSGLIQKPGNECYSLCSSNLTRER